MSALFCPLIRPLGHVAYVPTLAAMRAFTEARSVDTPDEIWLCEHPPVYTQGLAGKAEHVLNAVPSPSCKPTAAGR